MQFRNYLPCLILLSAFPVWADHEETLKADEVKTVMGSKTNATYRCNNNSLTIMGDNNRIKLVGKTNRVTIMGDSNVVTLEGDLKEASISGKACELRWDPKLDSDGFNLFAPGQGAKVTPPLKSSGSPSTAQPGPGQQGFDGRWFLQPIDGANGKIPIPRGLAIAILFGITGYAVSRIRPSSAAKMFADSKVPNRRWAQAAFGLLCTDGEDYGYANSLDTKLMLKQWWNITSKEALVAKIGELEANRSSAWDLCRAILLTRSGASVGWFSQDESWSRVDKQRQLLKAAYTSWEQMGEAVLVSRRTWLEIDPQGADDQRDGRMGETAANLQRLRKTLWKDTSF